MGTMITGTVVRCGNTGVVVVGNVGRCGSTGVVIVGACVCSGVEGVGCDVVTCSCVVVIEGLTVLTVGLALLDRGAECFRRGVVFFTGDFARVFLFVGDLSKSMKTVFIMSIARLDIGSTPNLSVRSLNRGILSRI